MSTSEDQVLDTNVDTGGFDIDEQSEEAKKENEGIPVPIHGIDERPKFFKQGEEILPVTIWVAGSHSDQYRRAEQMIRKRKLKPRNFTGEVIYEDNIEKVAACTLRWQGFYSRKKNDPVGTLIVVECNPRNVKELYKRCPWVLDQVMEAMTDHATFFEDSSPTE